MGWPRKNEQCRLYQEKRDGSYLLVNVGDGRNPADPSLWDAIGNVYEGSDPSLTSTAVCEAHLRTRCRRVAWSDMPRQWRGAFRKWLRVDPKSVPGFWRTP